MAGRHHARDDAPDGEGTEQRGLPKSGVRDAFHILSHHSNLRENMDRFAVLNRYHVTLFTYLLNKLQSTPDGDGTLLDHSMMLYGSAMSDGNQHNHGPLPIVLAGGASGALKGGRHIRNPKDTTMSNLLLAMLDKLGIPDGEVRRQHRHASDLTKRLGGAKDGVSRRPETAEEHADVVQTFMVCPGLMIDRPSPTRNLLSLMAQGDRRIHLRRTPSRQIARDQCDRGQRRAEDDRRHRFARRQRRNHRHQHLRDAVGSERSQGDSNENQRAAALQHQP